MAVGVGVVADGDGVLVLEFDECGHGVGAGAVHADFAIVIDGHEGEGGINFFIDDGEVEFVDFFDGFPVGEGGAAEGIGTDVDVFFAVGGDVDDIGEVVVVGGDVIVVVGGGETGNPRRGCV